MSEMTEARYSTVDMIGVAADLFSDPETVIGEYGQGVIQLISNLLGLTSDHYELVMVLIQDQVVIQNQAAEINSLRSENDRLKEDQS